MSGAYSRFFRLIYAALCLVLVSACASGPTPTPQPTPSPTLNANLWVDFPSLSTGQRQAANLAVTDPTGAPVSGITAVLTITAGSYTEQYFFPVTSADGTARVEVLLPTVSVITTFSMDVVVVDSLGGSDRAKASFDLYP
jgi:hypothetical protein